MYLRYVSPILPLFFAITLIFRACPLTVSRAMAKAAAPARTNGASGIDIRS